MAQMRYHLARAGREIQAAQRFLACVLTMRVLR
jgi:hypothetical protein